MKKLIVSMLTLLLLFSSTITYADSSTDLNKSEAERYHQLGFTDKEINDLTPEEIEYFNQFNGELVSSDTKYYRIYEDIGEDIGVNKAAGAVQEKSNLKVVEISKEQALLEVEQYNASLLNAHSDISIMGGGTDTKKSASWLTMTTDVSDLGGSPKEYLLKNSFTWLTEPNWALTDVLAITHPETVVHIQNSEIAAYTYDRYTLWSGNYIDTKTTNLFTADESNSRGKAFKIDILSGEGGADVRNHRGYMAFRVKQAGTDAKYGMASGHYVHSEIAIIFGLSIDMTGAGLSVSGTTKQTKATDTSVTYTF